MSTGKFTQATLLLTFAFKTLRVSVAWVAAFMANKAQQELYIEQVFLKQLSPPPLTTMLMTYLVFHMVLSAVVLTGVLAVSYLLVADQKLLFARALLEGFDFGAELVVTVLLGLVIADVITSKKYFSYQLEGLRAIRAYRDILFYITAIHALLPYYLTAPVDMRV